MILVWLMNFILAFVLFSVIYVGCPLIWCASWWRAKSISWWLCCSSPGTSSRDGQIYLSHALWFGLSVCQYSIICIALLLSYVLIMLNCINLCEFYWVFRYILVQSEKTLGVKYIFRIFFTVGCSLDLFFPLERRLSLKTFLVPVCSTTEKEGPSMLCTFAELM